MQNLTLLAFFSLALSANASFHLKTTDASNATHNNLYVYAYHTGASTNDAVLTPNVNTANPATLNGTNVVFDLGIGLPWGLTMDKDGGSSPANEPVRINPGVGSGGFTLGNDGLKWQVGKGFADWLVCQGPHSSPQLYWHDYDNAPSPPSGCSTVNLITEDTTE